MGDAVAATLASTAVGLVLLLTLVPLLATGRRGLGLVRAAVRGSELRWWHLTGGVCGALFVVSQGTSVGALGVAVFTVASDGDRGGTAVGSLAADRVGLGPSGRHPVTPARLAGAAACVAAVAVAGQGSAGGDGSVALILLAGVAGVAVAVQSGLNGRVGAVASSPWPATLVNFAVAAGTLTLVLGVRIAGGGGPTGGLPAEPLLYLAGLIGVGVIAVATLAVRRVGVLVFGLASVAGQLLGAVLLDALTPGHRPSVATGVGVVLTFLGLALAVRRR